MAQGYDQFFKAAKSKSKGGSPKPNPNMKKASSTRGSATSQGGANLTAEQYLREMLNVKESVRKRPKAGFPMMSLVFLLALGGGAYYGFENPEGFSSLLSKVQITVFSQSLAQDASKDLSEKNAQTDGGNAAGSAALDQNKAGDKCPESKGFTDEELSHFNKLSARKQELDLRERDLIALEEELHKQKSEIETRMAKLEQIREEVSTVLKERVEIDQERVNKLVEFYSNMKAKQAAEIFAKLNEDLAVEVLGKMKKKNAADILNLVEPTKARTLSEKFTGYVRR